MQTLRFAVPMLCAVAVACGSSTAPTTTDVVGSYSVSTFTSHDSTGTTNWLSQGALLNIVLTENDSTTGRLFVPGGADSGADLDADLIGTWLLHGDTVEFDEMADTFVRDMPFVYAGGKLTGQATFSGTDVKVVLAKQ